MYVHIWAYMQFCISISMQTHIIHTRIYIYIYIYICIYIYTYMYYISICGCRCTSKYMYIYICIHTILLQLTYRLNATARMPAFVCSSISTFGEVPAWAPRRQPKQQAESASYLKQDPRSWKVQVSIEP